MTAPANPASRKRFGRKPVKTPTPAYLKNVALHYLARYAASTGQLRRVLQNKLRRAAMRLPAFAADKTAQQTLATEIEKIITGFVTQGLIQDELFAAQKAASWRRAGHSKNRIAQKLRTAGITGESMERAVADADEDNEAAELIAAKRLAKRKRLGPYRPITGRAKPADDRDQRRKDMASLARAGFSLDIAKQVVNASDDDLEDAA